MQILRRAGLPEESSNIYPTAITAGNPRAAPFFLRLYLFESRVDTVCTAQIARRGNTGKKKHFRERGMDTYAPGSVYFCEQNVFTVIAERVAAVLLPSACKN